MIAVTPTVVISPLHSPSERADLKRIESSPQFECYRLCLLKNSIARKCSEKLCARMPYKRRSQFSGHFLSLDFGDFTRKRTFSTDTPVNDSAGRGFGRGGELRWELQLSSIQSAACRIELRCLLCSSPGLRWHKSKSIPLDKAMLRAMLCSCPRETSSA